MGEDDIFWVLVSAMEADTVAFRGLSLSSQWPLSVAQPLGLHGKACDIVGPTQGCSAQWSRPASGLCLCCCVTGGLHLGPHMVPLTCCLALFTFSLDSAGVRGPFLGPTEGPPRVQQPAVCTGGEGGTTVAHPKQSILGALSLFWVGPGV